jgi:hypothetical protein
MGRLATVEEKGSHGKNIRKNDLPFALAMAAVIQSLLLSFQRSLTF